MEWELMEIKDRLIVKTADGKGGSMFVLKNLSRDDGQRVIVANKDGDVLKAQTSYRVAAAKDSKQSINIITTGSVYLKILCLQKKTVQLLLPHQEKLGRGPKFELNEWMLLKEIPVEFDAVRTFVHNSCLKNHTLTRDWYLTMSIFVTDDNSVTKRGKLYTAGKELFELMYLGGILNIFQTVFYEEWRDHKDYGNTKPVSDVLFDWGNADPSEICLVEKRAVEKTFEFARRLQEDESYGGCKFSDGFFPTGKKGVGKGDGWKEVCRQVAKKTKDAAAAATAAAIEGQLDDFEDFDGSLDGLDELFLLGDNVSLLQDEHDPLLKHRTNNNNNDPLENMQFQPVDGDGDGDCSSLGDLSSVVPQGKPSHSFHMICPGSRPCGVTKNEFAYHLLSVDDVDGAFEESKASLKQRFHALARENESLKWRIDMLEQENQSLRPNQVWLGNKPFYRQRHQMPTIRPSRLMGSFGPRAVNVNGKLWFQDNGEWGTYVGEPLNSNDHRQGNGVMTYASGSTYEGGFVANKYHCEKAIHRCGGDCFEGPYNDGKRNGKVCINRYADGCVEYGSWYEGFPSGEGVLWSSDRSEAYRVIDGEKKGGISLAAAGKIAKERFNLPVPKM